MIYEKRGKWCHRDNRGKLHKFNTEEEAKRFVGIALAETVETELNGSEEEENYEEAFWGEEETDTDEQEAVCVSEGDGEEEVQSIPFGLR